MSDDVEATMADLDRRLRRLQDELEGGGRAEAPPRAEPARPEPEPARAAASAVDPLDQFGIELRRLAAELVAAWDRVVAHERGPGIHRIVLEAQADVHALSALERALADAPRVRTVELRAYAAGHASLVVDVS
jgi:hypothetical protein